MDKLEDIQFGWKPEEVASISTDLDMKEKSDLVRLFRRNNRVFTWSINQMLRVDPWVAFHRIDMDLNTNLIRQRPYWLALYIREKMDKEGDHLLSANFIKHVEYPKWVFNIVLVLKKIDKLEFVSILLT